MAAISKKLHSYIHVAKTLLEQAQDKIAIGTVKGSCVHCNFINLWSRYIAN